jgi:putative transposase
VARPLRIAFPGALYHITARGNRKESIFHNDKDRHHFLRIVTDVVEYHKWICHRYTLMGNHYHLLVETPQLTLSSGMRDLNGTYALDFNRAHGLTGHLFQGRFDSVLVSKESHFMEACRYIDLNAVRAGICADPGDYEWSSFRGTVGLSMPPPFLSSSSLLERFSPDLAKARAQYASFARDPLVKDLWDDLKAQIFLGDESFVAEMQKKAEPHAEAPKPQRQSPRVPLTSLLKDPSHILKAKQEMGYTIKEIAESLGVHPRTISRLIKRTDKDNGRGQV